MTKEQAALELDSAMIKAVSAANSGTAKDLRAATDEWFRVREGVLMAMVDECRRKSVER